MRAFVFSLDAFIAFTIAIMAIYSLIFFSSVPSAYYYLLTQTHFLSKDSLVAIATSDCVSVCPSGQTVLEAILRSEDENYRKRVILSTIGEYVPEQFGFSLDVSEDLGETWTSLYDSRSESGPHAKEQKKLSVATHLIYFSFEEIVPDVFESPYKYLSCGGATELDDGSVFAVSGGRLITCGAISDGSGGETPTGNLPPSSYGGDVIPDTEMKLVRLTVFI